MYNFLVPTAHNAATSPMNLHATDSPATLPPEHSERKLFIVPLLSKIAQWFEMIFSYCKYSVTFDWIKIFVVKFHMLEAEVFSR